MRRTSTLLAWTCKTTEPLILGKAPAGLRAALHGPACACWDRQAVMAEGSLVILCLSAQLTRDMRKASLHGKLPAFISEMTLSGSGR